MSEDSDQEFHLDVEHALQDAIDLVCKYASAKDLSNMAKVCKTWRVAALCEKQKRNFMQLLRFPYKVNNLTDLLNSTPVISLLFYKSTLEESLSLSLLETNVSWAHSNGYEIELLEIFKQQLPNLAIMLKVDNCLSTEDELFQNGKEQSDTKATNDSDILGLFLANKDGQIRVQVTLVGPQLDFLSEACANYITEELRLENCENNKTTIILITHDSLDGYPLLPYTIGALNKRAKESGKEITWGHFHGRSIAVSNCINDELSRQPSVWLSITGPNVECWSTCINCFAIPDQIESELYRLKEQVKRKRHYTGLLQAPSCNDPECSHNEHPIGDSHELMRILKRIFPDIPFTGFFVKTLFLIPHGFGDYDIDPPWLDYNGFKNIGIFSYLQMYTSIIILSY